jgi:hypothetical protein
MIDSPLYKAADEVLAYLADLKDEDNKLVFKSADFGVWVPEQNVTGQNTPALRVWVANPGYNVTTEQLFTGERDCSISIGIYNWLPAYVIMSGTDAVIASDGVTLTSATADFFGYDDFQLTLSDTTIAYVGLVVDHHTITLDRPQTPGTGISWWLRQSPQNPARVMVNYADYVLRRLQRRDVTGEGFEWSGDFWAPKPTQVIRPDYFGQLRKYNGNVPVTPPWFVVEIPLGADVWDLPE